MRSDKFFRFRFLITALDEAMEKAKSEEIRIPFGVGVAGTVAQTKTLMNIQNAYEVSELFFFFQCSKDVESADNPFILFF